MSSGVPEVQLRRRREPDEGCCSETPCLDSDIQQPCAALSAFHKKLPDGIKYLVVREEHAGRNRGVLSFVCGM